MPTSIITDTDVQRVMNVILGKDANPLTPAERSKYNITRTTPNIQDATALQQRMLNIPGQTLQQQNPAAYNAVTPVPTPANQGPSPAPYQPTQFQGKTPSPTIMSLDETMDIVNRKATLATQPRVEALERTLEEQQLSGEKAKGELQAGYEQSKTDLAQQGQLAQQSGSRLMARRNIYDSGMAAELANRISRSGMKMGLQLGQEQARALADLGEYLDLQTRHTNEQIQGIMGEKALMASTMLDDLRMQQQTRQDQLAQSEFENWLMQEANNLNNWQAQTQEYWRGTEFGAGRADTAWNQWFQEDQAKQAQNQAAWERISSMNRWQAEYDLQVLVANNQISQQQFQNAMALDEFDLKRQLYQWQYS